MARASASAEVKHGPGTDESQNESTPAAQRSGDILSPERAGPDVGERGEYKAAAYQVTSEVIAKDGSVTRVQAVREDR